MANDKDLPQGFQPFDAQPGSKRSVRYVPIAANYPVRMPADKTLPFTQRDVSDVIDFMQGIGLGTNASGVRSVPDPLMPFHTLTHDQLRELAYMPYASRRDFGLSYDKQGNLTSLPHSHLQSRANEYGAGRRNDARQYAKSQKAKEIEWLNDFNMDKVLGVDQLEQRIPVDDPNRESKVKYMDSVEKAYRDNADFLLQQQINHQQANQAKYIRDLLAKRRLGEQQQGTSVNPLTKESYTPVTNRNATTSAGLDYNPIWDNIANQMSGDLPINITDRALDPEKRTFFATDRERHGDYFDIDDYGIGAPGMNTFNKRLHDPNTSRFEYGLLRNGIDDLKRLGEPLPLMGSSFETPNTKGRFPLPQIVKDLPKPGSTKPTFKQELSQQAKVLGDEFKAFGKQMPLSQKIGLGAFFGSGAGALGIDALRNAQKSRTKPPVDEDALMRFMASDMGPVKGRRLNQLKDRFQRL